MNEDFSEILSKFSDILKDKDIDLNNLSSMTCTCPYFQGGNNCKHLAAVLFAVDDGVEEDVIEEMVIEDEYDIEKMVNECDELFLRYFLSEIIKEKLG